VRYLRKRQAYLVAQQADEVGPTVSLDPRFEGGAALKGEG
jgi:hypothetical protein